MSFCVISDVFGRFFPTRTLSRLYKRITCLPSAKWVKPWLSAETNDNLYYFICVNGVGYEHVKVTVHHKTVLIEAQGNDRFKTQRGFEKYVCWIDLPDIDSPNKRYKISDIKAEMKINDGEVKLIIPKFKREEKVFNVNINPIPEDEN
ncbi:heat shock 22 kDa protein, mitochondrial isoform X2 [Tanacetum coccineum]